MNEPIDYSTIHRYEALHVIEECFTSAHGDIEGAAVLLIIRCKGDRQLVETLNAMAQQALADPRLAEAIRLMEQRANAADQEESINIRYWKATRPPNSTGGHSTDSH